jgi:hypothetical protein
MNDSKQPAKRRILLVANETFDGEALYETIRSHARGNATEVLVTAPALNSRLRHWTSGEDRARSEAEGRLRRCLGLLSRAGVNARGVVGDADPVQAIADAACDFAPDEVVIATRSEKRSHWLTRHLVERARARFGFPILQIVVERSRGGYVRQPVAHRPREPTRGPVVLGPAPP